MNKVYAAQKQIESKVAKYISLSVFRACHDFRSLYIANKKIIEMYNLQSIFTLVCLLLTVVRTHTNTEVNIEIFRQVPTHFNLWVVLV